MKHRRHRLTLAYRLLLVFVLAFTTVWPLASPSTPLEAAPPDAPPTPTPSVSPTPQPSEPNISSQSITPPSPEDLPLEAEQAHARQAMEAALAKYLHYWGPRYQAAPVEAAVEGEWAHGVAQWQSQTKTLSGPIHILARRLPDGVWQALLPGSDGLYRQWLEAVPESLVPGEEKSQLRTQAAEADTLRWPQATPAVPPAASTMPPGKEGPGEPVSELVQPPVTPTPVSTPISRTISVDAQSELTYVPGEIIIKFRQSVSVDVASRTTSSSSVNNLLRSISVDEFSPLLILPDKKKLEDIPVLNRYFKITVPPDLDILELVSRLSENPDIELATLNYIGYIDRMPNDTYYWEEQWALNDRANAKLRMPQAWDITTGSSDVVVAVLDTGFDVTHPDLNAKNTYTGYDFVNDDWGIQDDQGHGTAVAGIIGAVSNNGQGVAGVSWGAMIMPVKVCDSNGACPSDATMNGIRWAADHGADIINMSLLFQSSGFGQIIWQDAVDYAYARGLVVSASAGNHREFLDNTDTTYYAPAELDHVITVGATNSNDEDCRPNFLGWAGNCGWGAPGTGYGPMLDVMAPGSADIWTTKLGGGYWSDFGGTSAAAPFVSGLAALILSVNSTLNPDQVESIIKHNAYPLDPYAEGHPNWSFGWGRIDAYASVSSVASEVCPQSGGVILYKHANYNCSGEGEGSGYVIRLNSGWQNVPSSFNDQASSLKIPSGWSARLYEHADRNGASVCRNGDDSDFAGDYFDGGSVPLNDHVSSFEAFDNTNCNSSPPLSGNWEAKYFNTRTCWDDHGQCNNPQYTENLSIPGGNVLLDKNWGSSSPGGSVNNDNWTGYFQATLNFSPGDYVFYADHDDGLKLKIGNYGEHTKSSSGSGSLICDGQGGYTLNGDTPLHVYLREDGGDARIRLWYSTDTSVCVSTPDPPTLQSPSNGSTFNEGQSITLAWSATGDEYYGEVWGGPAGTTPFGWQSGTSKNIGSQWAGYTYSWRVKARNSAGESGWSSTWTFTVKPGTPSLSAQALSCNQINLYWNDSSGSEEGYKIYRNGSYIDQVGADITSYQNTGLSENTDYSYYVRAFRGSIESNNSNTVNVHTPPCPTGPDLTPAQWSGWQYPIVPSSITGTTIINTLYAGYSTYIDWGLANNGDTNTGGNTYGDLYIDSTRYAHYNFGNVLAGQSWAFFDWTETVNTPGWHTLKVVTDPDNLIAESNETNNVWEHQFYWTPSAPYSDNMENGTNDWTATGLWHQVDGNSPYPASHSGTRSWWYGQDSTGNYDTGSANSGDLASPSIYIPTSGYYLRFWYRYETETRSPNWDQRWVQISVDGGPFNNVLQLYDDPMNWWLQSPAVNLSGYAGHTLRVRFHFDTLDDGFNAYRGWYLDDFDISSTPPPSCADSHEPNNSPAQATTIAYGQARNADICPGGDYDFYQFIGAAGDRVVVDIDAKANGSWLDSYVFLLDSDGTNVLAENDDEIVVEVQDSHLGYQLPHNGTYYIKVRAWDHPSVGGTDYFYTIRLLRDHTNPSSAAITSPGNDAWLDPSLETITVSATDNQSGISHVAFLWHGADWENSDWIWLGEDWDGRDGWSWDFDTSSLAEQRGGAFYSWAFDWAGNWTGAGDWNLGIDRTPPTAGADVSLMYGDAPFLDFYVWWSGSDNLSGIASYDVQYRDGPTGTWANLLAGTTDTYYRFVGQNGHTYYFRARARDYAGNLSTYASGGGDAQHTVQICAVAADAYESDNSHTTAKAIAANGAWQAHNFHAAGDRDWLKFTAVAGITYTLVTTNTGGHADTTISVYASDGVTLLAFNDDDPDNWPASRLAWGARRDGTYYVKVEHWDPYAYGCTTAYNLSIAKTGTFEVSEKVFLPIILRNVP